MYLLDGGRVCTHLMPLTHLMPFFCVPRMHLMSIFVCLRGYATGCESPKCKMRMLLRTVMLTSVLVAYKVRNFFKMLIGTTASCCLMHVLCCHICSVACSLWVSEYWS